MKPASDDVGVQTRLAAAYVMRLQTAQTTRRAFVLAVSNGISGANSTRRVFKMRLRASLRRRSQPGFSGMHSSRSVAPFIDVFFFTPSESLSAPITALLTFIADDGCSWALNWDLYGQCADCSLAPGGPLLLMVTAHAAADLTSCVDLHRQKNQVMTKWKNKLRNYCFLKWCFTISRRILLFFFFSFLKISWKFMAKMHTKRRGVFSQQICNFLHIPILDTPKILL